MKNTRGVSFWLYALGIYILFQFFWWAWLLIDQTAEISHIQVLSAETHAFTENNNWLPRRVLMIIGEGFVFLVILVLGFLKVKSALRKELNLAHKQRNFLLSVTHELNTPIASVKLFLQTLLKREFPVESRLDLTTKALGEIERLRELVQNILTTAQIEEGQFQLLKKKGNLSAFISSELESVKPLLKTHQLEIEIDDEIEMSFDENAIRSVFLNLLENAAKYSSAGSLITIQLHTSSGHPCLSITDEGIGINEVELALVYEKFYRVENEIVRKNKGTGLGLFIVKNMLELHGGRIEYVKNEPKGSTFKVYL
ncbi:MAG: hypothetical protein KDC83_12075 [Flavobacteriales bacterium]|nr:hypothetical protein [Flavobacteriales bacterium]